METADTTYHLLHFGPPNESSSLPSWHPQCLVALSYAKFINLNPVVERCDNPEVSNEQILPLLAIPKSKQFISGYKEIIEYLNKHNFFLDLQFSETEQKQIEDIKNLIETKLHHCLWFDWCLQPENFRVIANLYTKQIPFPISYYISRKLKAKIEAQLSAVYNGVHGIEEKVFQEAATCYSTLSTLLGDKQFLFGDRPSSADALAFGYLACQLFSDLPSSRLHTDLTRYHNLVRYCDYILKICIGEEPTKSIQKNKKTPLQSAHTARNAMFVGGSLAAMVAYTVWELHVAGKDLY